MVWFIGLCVNKYSPFLICKQDLSQVSLQRARFKTPMTLLPGLQERCGAVFQQLANASCVLEERQEPQGSAPAAAGLLSTKPKLARLHTAHALSLHLVLSRGLEMGSHATDCWPHVFR